MYPQNFDCNGKSNFLIDYCDITFQAQQAIACSIYCLVQLIFDSH